VAFFGSVRGCAERELVPHAEGGHGINESWPIEASTWSMRGGLRCHVADEMSRMSRGGSAFAVGPRLPSRTAVRQIGAWSAIAAVCRASSASAFTLRSDTAKGVARRLEFRNLGTVYCLCQALPKGTCAKGDLGLSGRWARGAMSRISARAGACRQGCTWCGSCRVRVRARSESLCSSSGHEPGAGTARLSGCPSAT